jgi:hypothetical protein
MASIKPEMAFVYGDASQHIFEHKENIYRIE